MSAVDDQVQALREALQKANNEAGDRRHRLNREKNRHEATREALRDAQRLLLKFAASDRLAHPDAVLVWIEGGLNAVLDDAGVIVWDRFDRLLADLLEKHPYLGVSRPSEQAGR